MDLVIKKDTGKDFGFKALDKEGETVAVSAGATLEEGNAGLSPMQLFLTALGGCMSIDVMLLLKKKKQEVTDYQVDIKTERVDGVPSVFSKIHLTVVVEGIVGEEKLKQSIALSRDKLCSVYKMISKEVEVVFAYKLNGKDGLV